MNAIEVEPRLGPPGAGLPWLELRAARMLFGWSRRRATRETTGVLLAEVRAEILEFALSLDPETASRRVLIDRLRGMEDSSRFWSVFMTLDHLRIVNVGIAGTIRSLCLGQIPAREARTADVKPSPLAGAEVVAEFENSCDEITRSVVENPDLRTALKFAHPWFGPLDAESWYFLSAFHMRLHLGQIQQILAAQRKTGPF